MDDARIAALRRHNPRCLGCGTENPSSVGFRIGEASPGRVRGTAVFAAHHEGAPGRTHGGAVATALDEAVGQLAQLETDGGCVTAELAVRYLRPTPTGAGYEVEAHVTARDGRKLWIDARLAHDGEPLATATALMIELRPEEPA